VGMFVKIGLVNPVEMLAKEILNPCGILVPCVPAFLGKEAYFLHTIFPAIRV